MQFDQVADLQVKSKRASGEFLTVLNKTISNKSDRNVDSNEGSRKKRTERHGIL